MRVALGALAALSLVWPGGSATAGTRPTSAASPPPSVFGIGPSNGKTVDGRPYYYFVTVPGATFKDHVAVVNVGTKQLTLSVYPTDAANSTDGSLEFPAAAVKPTDVGTWVHVQTPSGTRQVVIPGRTTVYLPITVHVPQRAYVGDHAGAVIASILGLARNSQGQLIHLDQRVAARIFIRISGPLHPQLTVENLHVTYHGTANPLGRGSAEVTYTVHNTGNVKLGANQKVEVSGLLGTHATAVNPPQVPLLLPDGSVREKVMVTGVLPTVANSVTVTLTGLALPSDSNPAAGPWTASTRFWAIPWTLVLLLLLVAAAVLGWRWRRRRQKAPGASAGPGDGPGGPGGPDELPDGPGPPEVLAADVPDAPEVGSRR
jgi:hypothetical protein